MSFFILVLRTLIDCIISVSFFGLSAKALYGNWSYCPTFSFLDLHWVGLLLESLSWEVRLSVRFLAWAIFMEVNGNFSDLSVSEEDYLILFGDKPEYFYPFRGLSKLNFFICSSYSCRSSLIESEYLADLPEFLSADSRPSIF